MYNYTFYIIICRSAAGTRTMTVLDGVGCWSTVSPCTGLVVAVRVCWLGSSVHWRLEWCDQLVEMGAPSAAWCSGTRSGVGGRKLQVHHPVHDATRPGSSGIHSLWLEHHGSAVWGTATHLKKEIKINIYVNNVAIIVYITATRSV